MTNKNPFNSFLFSIPGKHTKYTYEELVELKNIKNKEVEIIDTCSKKKIGKMKASYALLKFG
jgi:hypothetical protein